MLLRPHRQIAAVGAVLAGSAGAAVAGLELRSWIESLMRWAAVTGLVCITALLAVPLRRWRQRRWSSLAERGNAPDWPMLVPRLQRVRHFSWAMLAAAWVAAAIGARSSAIVTERYERLEARADEVRGEVIERHDPAKGMDSMRVRFASGGETHEVKIVDVPARFAEGGTVTVLVDPLDPTGATVKGVERSTFAERAVQTFAVLVALVLATLGALGVRRASMAGDALLATGLRPCKAWWKHSFHGYRLVRPGGRGRGIEIGEVMLANQSVAITTGPVLSAGPDRGPLVLVDPTGFLGTVRRPLLPPWDLRRVLRSR